MPELPEVEVVRRGLAEHAGGRTLASVSVLHPRAVRRHAPGARDFEERLAGRRVVAACRRGKYLWLEVDGDEAVVGHLGMSGQFLVSGGDEPDPVHLRVRLRFADTGPELRFVDQRTFGGLALAPLVTDGADGWLPAPVAHIARDPLDPAFDEAAVLRRMRGTGVQVKRVLLDQTVLSGVGNIYADEALWRARLHGERPSDGISRPRLAELLGHVRSVLGEALAEGGTSFDSLYVNVNGQSGYFDRSLAAYGQEGRPCPRCGTPIRRIPFMNRSSHVCPRCQPRPRRPAG